jgi:hypothetical protein
MGYFLWHLLRDAYQELGQLQVGKATGGSSTTVVDSNLIDTGKDDDWKDGMVIILEDAGGVGVAPEGEFARVDAYSDGNGTLTIDSLTAAVSAGDVYGLASAYYPLHQMIELANLALRKLGDLVLVDTTTLDTVEAQTEYAAAVAWKRRPPRQIDIQSNPGDLDDHRWRTLFDWEFVPSAAGQTGLIVFKTQPPAGRDLRIWYEDLHPRVNSCSDVIHETIHPALAAAALVESALNWQISRLEGENIFMLEQVNHAKIQLERMKMFHPIWKASPKARMRLAGLGR